MEILNKQSGEKLKYVDNNLAIQLSSINEHTDSYIQKNREKFQSISEKAKQNKIKRNSTSDDINSEENINTDETILEEPILNDQTEVYEFSVSTLDRKLKEIKRNKNISNKPRCLSLSNNVQKTPVNLYKDQTSDKLNNITIMMNPSKLINDHLNEIQLRIIGHTRSAIMYETREKIIGYPVTILSSFITSAIMMSITSDNLNSKDIIKYISLTLSIMSFIFSVSRDYLNFSRKFQSHDLSSKLYTTLLRSTEVRLINNHLSKDDKRGMFKDIVDQMSIIEQYETPIPGSIEKEIRKENAKLNN
jgi:hypothetical protein